MTESQPPASATTEAREETDRSDRLLLEYLVNNDAACPVCGYNVRGLTRPVCPECRHRLRLTVGATDVTLRWFLAAIAPGVFSGIAAIFLAIPLIVSPLIGNGSAPGFIIATDVFGFTSGIAALVMMAQRKPIVAMPAGNQQMLVAIVWAVHILAFIALLGVAFGWY